MLCIRLTSGYGLNLVSYLVSQLPLSSFSPRFPFLLFFLYLLLLLLLSPLLLLPLLWLKDMFYTCRFNKISLCLYTSVCPQLYLNESQLLPMCQTDILWIFINCP